MNDNFPRDMPENERLKRLGFQPGFVSGPVNWIQTTHAADGRLWSRVVRPEEIYPK